MSSGIYKLTFASGKTYIGKAEDIDRRWKQHAAQFHNKTHTKRMQAEYDTYGVPNYEVMFLCHRDHVDLIENIFIQSTAGPNSLNGVAPKPLDPKELDTLVANQTWLELSTSEHLYTLQSTVDKHTKAEKDLEKLRSKGIKTPKEIQELQEQYNQLVKDNNETDIILTKLHKRLIEAEQEVKRFKSLGFWDRVFY